LIEVLTHEVLVDSLMVHVMQVCVEPYFTFSHTQGGAVEKAAAQESSFIK